MCQHRRYGRGKGPNLPDKNEESLITCPPTIYRAANAWPRVGSPVSMLEASPPLTSCNKEVELNEQDESPPTYTNCLDEDGEVDECRLDKGLDL